MRIIGEKDAEFHRRLALKRAVPPALAKAALDVRDSSLVKQAHESFLAAGRQFRLARFCLRLASGPSCLSYEGAECLSVTLEAR